MVIEEELEVEERMGAGMEMGMDGTSPSGRMFRVREMRKLGGWRMYV